MESGIHPSFSANTLTVLEKRYLKKDKEGRVVETPEEMLWRVAENIASAERLYHPQADTGESARRFYRLMSSLTFLPNSPTLMNAGRSLQQLAACFVLPIEDSLESIFNAVKHKCPYPPERGGTGFSFSRVRPREDIVGTTGGVASEDEAFRTIRYRDLEEAVRLAVRFLDNVIDVNRYPLPEIEAMAKGNRKIGLGVMGFADLLLLLGIPYDSEEALQVAEELMSFIQKIAWEESARLARERGPFPNFEKSVFKESNRRPVPNATVTTIAPTGTLSILANCTGGIEPLFAVSHERSVLGGMRLREVSPSFLHLARREGLYSEALTQELREGRPLTALPPLPGRIAAILRTAVDITPEWHVRMQAAFQKHTDNAVSKTINFPPHASVEDVARAFRLAYELGCKGITVYRSGSREHEVLACGSVLVC